jgi:hypothetical protein
MTSKIGDYKSLLTVANLIILVGFIVQQSRWQQSIDSSIEKFEEHQADKNMHMPLTQKIEFFVPRIELDVRLDNMEKILEKIEAKID